MAKKNIFKQMNNEGHLMPSQLKFQYNVMKDINQSKRVKEKDVFDYTKKKEIKKANNKKK
tara:strand:+ start:393 stop:572 length:180 start_codon:yes stop_codon:yes gene_type:complete